MTTHTIEATRRQVLAGLGATTALTLGGCVPTPRPEGIAAAQRIGAERLLETVAYNLLDIDRLIGATAAYSLVLIGLLAGGLALGLSRLDAVQRMLTPRIDQMRQVDLRAQIEFYEIEMTQTQDRTGILLFVSLLEHRAVVLADRSIAEKLDAKIWQELVDLMIQGVKRGDLAAGMTQAIQRCGELLSPHFPIADDDINELRNHLVVKE
ncbi:MAG: hypothetical protein IH827_04975 [Myxococcales bacterium]|nr:hypothetical protein [Myxococcales bacterium]